MDTIRKIYKAYGGPRAFLTSVYLWLSVFFAILLHQGITDDTDWLSFPIRIIPPLVGFTFASFSLLFAILDDDSRLVLSQRDIDFGNEKPIMVIVSKIVHSVFVQLCALISALMLATKPIVLPLSKNDIEALNFYASIFALFLFIYGLMLVFAVATTLFQLVDLVSDASDVSSSDDSA